MNTKTFAFSNNQSAIIAIGQWWSPSYGELNPEGGLAFDPSGNLWVTDTNRVLGFATPFSDNMSSSFVLGQSNFTRIEAAVSANSLSAPEGVTFDREGNMWVADTGNNRVVAFEPPFRDGMNASVAIGQPSFTSKSATTTRNGLSEPTSIVFDASGNLWIADSSNSRILEFQPPFTSAMNASLVIGETDFTHKYCEPLALGHDSSCSNHSTLRGPFEVAFDPSGDLWIGEGQTPTAGGRLLEYKPPFKNNMFSSLVIEPVFPSAFAFDSAGNLWLGCRWCGPVGGGRVLGYEPPFNDHSVVWENGVAMNSNFTLGEYNGDIFRPNVVVPIGLTFDSTGNLWVADSRASWSMPGVFGRILGFDAQVHFVNTENGPVYFENNGGLLTPLSSTAVPQVGSMAFPEGLFNFTIQGLPAGGSVILTILFPHILAPGITWASHRGGQWNQLPASQVQINGRTMTLTLGNASENGVISELGGPIFALGTVITSPTTTATVISQPPITPVSAILGIITAVVVIATAIRVYRRRWPRVRLNRQTRPGLD